MEKNSTVKTIIIYHYTRGGVNYVTPSIDIAIARRDEDSEIRRQLKKGDDEEFSLITFN